jgi:hypothetical protein
VVESVIVRGRDLEVIVEQGDLFDQRAALTANRETERRRHRPDMANISTATEPAEKSPITPNLGRLIEQLTHDNPWWSAEANADAEANPDGLTPKQLARKWRGHQIEPQETV